MNKFAKYGFGVALGALMFSGCATTTLQTNAKMTQSIFINPVSKEKRVVFVGLRNTSGQNINLSKVLNAELQSRGYRITDNPEEATYTLMVNVLYCDKKQENNAARGAVAGGLLSGSIGAYNYNRNSQSLVAGAAGALVGGLLAKATEDTIYQMQVDIVIREKVKGKVEVSKGSVSSQASVVDSRKSGFMNEFAGSIRNSNSSGKLNSNSVTTDEQKYESDFIEHRTMLFAEASKMNLSLEEAIPVLEQKIATQIAGLF